MKTRIGMVLALLATACNWGMRPQDFPPALGPAGAHATLMVRGQTTPRVGELIAVDSVGIAVRNDGSDRIVRVPWANVYTLDIDDVSSDYAIDPGETVTQKKRDRIALLARFPQGLRHLPITLDSLLPTARSSTSRFIDRRVAIAEGYRRVGADFPGMGEHWLNPDLLFAGQFDPARPALLTYATIDSAPTLLGVGFLVIVRGDSVPAGLPGWPEHWHEHSGLLADETRALGVMSYGAGDTHIWVMHAWTRLENPDGPFSADNWSLAFVRAGLTAPSHSDADASRALSLVGDGDRFLRGVLTDAGLRTDANATAVDSTIAVARSHAIVAEHTADATSDLHDTWNALVSQLEQVTGPDVRGVLAARHSGPHR